MAKKTVASAFLVLALTGLMSHMSAAQDKAILYSETAMLQSSDHAELMRAAAATCLLTPKDRNTILSRLEHAKWAIGGEDEWIEAGFNDVWITLMGSNDDFFCDVQGDISQAAALAGLQNVLTTANWQGWTVTREDRECHSLTHPDGIGIYITSSGNDPVCTPTPHSAIRISAQKD